MSSLPSLVELAVSAGSKLLSTSFLMTVVRRAIAASGSSSQLHVKELASDLNQLFRRLWADLPEAARGEIREPQPEHDTYARTFVAGQISFANAMLAQMAELRESDKFRECVLKPDFAPYIQALLEGEKNGVELARAVGVEDETVSRRLSVLRQLGISDFRREGRSIINFLTPAARGVCGNANLLQRMKDRPMQNQFENESTASTEKNAALQDMIESVPPHMQQAQHVATPEGELLNA